VGEGGGGEKKGKGRKKERKRETQSETKIAKSVRAMRVLEAEAPSTHSRIITVKIRVINTEHKLLYCTVRILVRHQRV